jgi:ElaB/YqjD/DUF883 family membrane-anchored ribosome-binding protein
MDQTHTPSSTGSTLRQEAGADRERLLSHLREAVSDAEQWLNAAPKDAPADIEQAKTQFRDAIDGAKTDLLKLEDTLLARGKLACKAADSYVQESPWIGVGIAAAAGIALGYLIGRE